MTEARPTHLDLLTGAAVFPGPGHVTATLEPLPSGYWEAKDVEMQAAAIRINATAQILAIAPYHVQINDIRDPLRAGAAARSAQIDTIRQQANTALAALGVTNGTD
jgi:hypothetical protein